MKWLKNLFAGSAPDTEIKGVISTNPEPPHPSEEIIKDLFNNKRDIQKILEGMWPKSWGVGYCNIDKRGSQSVGDVHIHIRVSMYLHKVNGNEFGINNVPDFFSMVVKMLGYPPVREYTVTEKKNDDLYRPERNKHVVELLFQGEEVLFVNPIRIMFDFRFLQKNTQEDFDILKRKVSEAAESYFLSPSIYKVKGIIEEAQEQVYAKRRREQEADSEKLQGNAGNRTITVEPTSECSNMLSFQSFK